MPTTTDNGTYPLPTGTDPPDLPYWLDQLGQGVEDKAVIHTGTGRKRMHIVTGLSGTTDASGNLTVTHGAGFTPRVVIPQMQSLVSVAHPVAVGSMTGSVVTVRFQHWSSGGILVSAAVNSLALICWE